MKRLLIRNGRVIDPANKVDRITNILISDGRIAAFDASASPQDEIIEAAGKIVAPGLIDMHVHLREPGREEDETIESGTASALAGGFTAVAVMPNTSPPIDTQAAVEFIQHQAERANNCHVYVIACVSKDRAGKELAELGQLAQAGAVGFSDDGAPVYDAELMRRAYEYANMFGKPIMNHEEVLELTKGAVMHEGIVSMELGLTGMPATAEEIMISRDIALAEATNGKLHVLHISTAGSVELVREARRRGIHVTTEVCPHHFTLTDECMRTFDSNYKMSPPLRTQRDVDACIEGLRDGTIEVICTDHAPHAQEKKMREIDQAPFGILGLETCLPLTVTYLIERGILSWPQAIEKLTINPARILNIPKGHLGIGADADITIIDPTVRWTYDVAKSPSKSRNSPYHGHEFIGRAVCVIVDGVVKYRC